MASYCVFVQFFGMRQKVIQALSRPGYGATTEEVLTACRIAAEAELMMSDEEITTIQEEVNISRQTWKRMIAVSKNQQLWEHKDILPSSFSSLYRLSLLSQAVLAQAIDDGSIDSKITTRQIESLSRSIGIRSRFKTSKHSIFLFCKNELGDDELTELLSRVNNVASEYDACFDTQDLVEIQKENNRRYFDIQRQMIDSQIHHEIRLITSPAAHHDGINLSEDVCRRLNNLPIDLPFGKFVKVIKSFSSNREEMMRCFGRLYCFKLAQEYWSTQSRSQRYNCKKRLKEVEKAYPVHAQHARLLLNALTQADDDESAEDNQPGGKRLSDRFFREDSTQTLLDI